MSYIRGEEGKDESCIFDRAADLRFSKKDLILRRDENTVVLMNRFPYANGHLLAAPARHVGDIADLSPEESISLMQIVQICVTILRKHLQPHGFNIGLNIGEVAGAGLADHLHFHVVPRWDGDHNFMTVIGDIRTIPEHIENSFDLLLPDFKAIPAEF